MGGDENKDERNMPPTGRPKAKEEQRFDSEKKASRSRQAQKSTVLSLPFLFQLSQRCSPRILQEHFLNQIFQFTFIAHDAAKHCMPMLVVHVNEKMHEIAERRGRR